MKYIQNGPEGTRHLELTRRNLLALLSKLDGNPPGSACTLIDPDGMIEVKAVEDYEHYGDRPPGPVHSDTEEGMRIRWAYGSGPGTLAGDNDL